MASDERTSDEEGDGDIRFVAYITVNGQKLWARDYGYSAWPIRV